MNTKNRTARVSCVSVPLLTFDKQDENMRIKWASDLIDQAAIDEPDLMILPEMFAQLHIPYDKLHLIDEPVNGHIFSAIASKAKQHNCYILCPAIVKEDGSLFNTVAIIDRHGERVGTYKKYMPAMSEIKIGIKPGTELGIFDTDFGKIGIVLCFDLNFLDEIGKHMKQQGVKLVCFSSMWEGGFQTKRWAFDLQCYLASAVFTGRISRIVNPLGCVIGENSEYSPILTKEINLDFEVCHLDLHLEKIKQVRAKYGLDVFIDISTVEDRFIIASNVKDKSTDDILREFGIERLESFYQRCRTVVQDKRKSEMENL